MPPVVQRPRIRERHHERRCEGNEGRERQSDDGHHAGHRTTDSGGLGHRPADALIHLVAGDLTALVLESVFEGGEHAADCGGCDTAGEHLRRGFDKSSLTVVDDLAAVGAWSTSRFEHAAPALASELVLAAGTWAVTFAREGFEAEQRGDVGVPAGEPRQLDVTLALPPFVERVDVVGVTPLPGAGVDRDRVPGVVTRVGGAEIAERGASSFADALHERLGAVTLEGTTTNLFQPTLRFRGFTASPRSSGCRRGSPSSRTASASTSRSATRSSSTCCRSSRSSRRN